MAEMSYKKRQNLPDSSFAIVRTVKNKITGKTRKIRNYPINDLAHAKNALARVAAHGSPEEKKAIRSKVCKRYPNLPTCQK
jgi:predicted transcriptional regulator